MAIFKYTIANKEGKKLSGNVEAPDENTARSELQNLGFSILLLQESKEIEKTNSNLNKFVFEAIDKNTKLVSGTIPAQNQEEAIKKLESEYDLNVSAIWAENSTPQQIETARKEGQNRLENALKNHLQNQTSTPAQLTPSPKTVNPENEQKIQFVKTKIELILKSVNDLLTKFDQDLAPDHKAEINKKIDKLLRIKNSTNLDYILESANELLKFLEEQEKFLKENTHQEKRLEYQVETHKMLATFNQGERQKSLSEDILDKIHNWQKEHDPSTPNASFISKIIHNVLNAIKDFFTTPPEIKAIENQISTYNKQIWEFIKLYFKEPTKEYKKKVKNSIKAVWETRKKAKQELKAVKIRIKEEKNRNRADEEVLYSLVKELNALTGWLLGFYIIYYFTSLYLTTKNFGFSNISSSFQVYDSHIFKYILVITFLLHSTSALKINFFSKSTTANFVLPPVFIFGSIITLLNF